MDSLVVSDSTLRYSDDVTKDLCVRRIFTE